MTASPHLSYKQWRFYSHIFLVLRPYHLKRAYHSFLTFLKDRPRRNAFGAASSIGHIVLLASLCELNFTIKLNLKVGFFILRLDRLSKGMEYKVNNILSIRRCCQRVCNVFIWLLHCYPLQPLTI